MTTLRRILKLSATEGDAGLSESRPLPSTVPKIEPETTDPDTPSSKTVDAKEAEKDQIGKPGKRRRSNPRENPESSETLDPTAESVKKRIKVVVNEAVSDTEEKKLKGTNDEKASVKKDATDSVPSSSNSKPPLAVNKPKVLPAEKTSKNPVSQEPRLQDKTPEEAAAKMSTGKVASSGDESSGPNKKTKITSNDLLVLKPRPPPRNASKRCPGRNDGEKKEQTTDPSPPAETVTKPTTLPATSAKKKAKQSSASGASNPNGSKQELNWVMCDRCEKWRTIPGFVDVKKLSQVKWYCEMNEWDPAQASCDAPDTYAGQGASRQRQRQRQKPGVGGSGESKPAGKGGRVGGKVKGKAHAGTSDSKGSGTSAKKQDSNPNDGRRRDTSINKVNQTPNAEAHGTWQWVMCETCQQWRKLPPHVDVSRLPDKWYCSMNKWDPLRARCSAAQEQDEQKLIARHQEEQAAIRNHVRLPPGVNLYGNWSMSTNRKLVAPNNYRELIVNHYRHFRNWDQVASATCNARYAGSSLFIPKGHNRRSKKAKQLGSPSTVYKLLFQEALSPQHPKHRANKPAPESDVAGQEEGPENRSLEARCFPSGVDGNGAGTGLLRLTKPWKRLGGWVAGDKYCSHAKALTEQ